MKDYGAGKKFRIFCYQGWHAQMVTQLVVREPVKLTKHRRENNSCLLWHYHSYIIACYKLKFY